MSNIEYQGYVLLKNVLSKEVLELLKYQIIFEEKNKCYENNVDKHSYVFNDDTSQKSFSVYGLSCFEALLLQLNPLINKYCEKRLEPTYSYARIYYNGSILNKHTDRPACEYSITCCISCEGESWDINMKYKNNKEVCIKMNEGDIVIYKGIEVEHWREKYDGERQIQAFLHYVDKNGIYKDQIYDKRPFIGIK